MSVAVAVGFIAFAGVAAETGVVMLIYLKQAAIFSSPEEIEKFIDRPGQAAIGSGAADPTKITSLGACRMN